MGVEYSFLCLDCKEIYTYGKHSPVIWDKNGVVRRVRFYYLKQMVNAMKRLEVNDDVDKFEALIKFIDKHFHCRLIMWNDMMDMGIGPHQVADEYDRNVLSPEWTRDPNDIWKGKLK